MTVDPGVAGFPEVPGTGLTGQLHTDVGGCLPLCADPQR